MAAPPPYSFFSVPYCFVRRMIQTSSRWCLDFLNNQVSTCTLVSLKEQPPQSFTIGESASLCWMQLKVRILKILRTVPFFKTKNSLLAGNWNIRNVAGQEWIFTSVCLFVKLKGAWDVTQLKAIIKNPGSLIMTVWRIRGFVYTPNSCTACSCDSQMFQLVHSRPI